MRQKQSIFSLFLLSPSSRRAWIEIAQGISRTISSLQSPSSWRAWIEIGSVLPVAAARVVALLAEGVDRNAA